MDSFKNSKLANFYEYGGAIIIILVFILFLAYGYKLVFQGKEEPSPVILVRNHVPNYYNVLKEIKKRNQSDSLLAVLLSEKENFVDSIQVLNRKINEVNIDNSDTENKVKIVASIIAVIVAVVGFFGFKSLNDIREHSIKNSQIDAKDVAEKVAKKTLEDLRSKTVSLEELVKSMEYNLNSRMANLEKNDNEVQVIVGGANPEVEKVVVFENMNEVIDPEISKDAVKDISKNIVDGDEKGNNSDPIDPKANIPATGAIETNNINVKDIKNDLGKTDEDANIFN